MQVTTKINKKTEKDWFGFMCDYDTENGKTYNSKKGLQGLIGKTVFIPKIIGERIAPQVFGWGCVQGVERRKVEIKLYKQ